MTGWRKALFRGALASTAFVLVALAALVPFAGTALVVQSSVSSPDVIVSLASHEWERLPEAAFQARAFPGAVVVLTVPKQVTPYNCHDCALRPERLIGLGLDQRRIREVPIVGDGTYGEALAIKAFMLDHDLHRLLVVTSPYHTRRSLATFRSVLAGTSVTAGVVPASRTSPARPHAWWWTAYDRAYVPYEWAAILYYGLKYSVTSLL